MRSLFFRLLPVLAALALLPARAQLAYNITATGPISGTDTSVATAVNATGLVAGTSGSTSARASSRDGAAPRATCARQKKESFRVLCGRMASPRRLI